MVLKTLKGLLRPEATHTYRCYDCGREFESAELRYSTECPDCGGPPEPGWQE
ncbi:hypothetical protein [Haloarcula sp. JP-L23]|uniref:hypothetical protein n=1 Tax=Haloarcula sp. JP-L23 TaxID=2716717 RepID=UPI00140F3289|nr:hypothetical protein G9465_00700 [Haloarcula sp. JP-L23]